MPSYRLLRSNKESGPYSLNDLVKLGLKPYDLVWVDGRSAAWRYPSEISELKEYAPTVEEQPYDRFFKKPSEPEAAKATTETEPPVSHEIPSGQKSINETFAKAEPIYRPSPSTETVHPPTRMTPEIPNPSHDSLQPQSRKKVFVSMPETIGFAAPTDTYPDQKYEQYLPKQKPVQPTPLPPVEKSHSSIDIRESDESKLETKYTQSLDDIKEMYINTLVQRKTKNRRKEIVRRYVKPALLPLLLVIIGVIIGYFITIKKTAQVVPQSISTVTPSQKIPQPKQTIPEQSSEDPLDQNGSQPQEKPNPVALTDTRDRESKRDQEKQENSAEKIQAKRFTPVKEHNDETAVSKKTDATVSEEQTFVPSRESSPIQKKNVEADPSTGERKSVVRGNNDVRDENMTSTPERPTKKNNSERTFLNNEHKNLLELVSVKSNNYVRGAFGGIRGLELTVFNNSDYLLDEVNVELQIMKPSEQPLRTDVITFKNISANGAVTVKVPDSQRGIRVDYRITNIESKQWQKSTAGL